jgi:PAS domain S-box-containing protein
MKPRLTEPGVELASIVACSDDAIISNDLEGNITSWNDSAERMFGYTYAESKGKHISLIIPSERLPEEEMIQKRLRANECIKHFETTRRNKSGHLIPILFPLSGVSSNDVE